MTEETKKAGLFTGTSRGSILVMAGLAVAAVLGWSETFSARSEVSKFQATLAAADLDAASPDRLNLAIAERQRELIRIENALVSKSAAAGARDQQIATATVRVNRLEGEASAATTAAREAAALFADLDDQNRFLSRRVSELASSAVSWEAAAGSRRAELDMLIAEVETNQVLVSEAQMWRTESERLTAEKEKLARSVVGLENTIVSLAAAVDYRQRQVADAAVALSSAEAEQRTAYMEALALRAEASDLTRAIGDLTEERSRINKALVAVNNRFIPALAAVEAREKQLQDLGATVAVQRDLNEKLVADNAALQSRMEAIDSRIADLSQAASEAARYLTAINQVLATPTVQAALSQ